MADGATQSEKAREIFFFLGSAVLRLCRDRVHAVPELKKCFLFAGHPMDIFVLSISYSMFTT